MPSLSKKSASVSPKDPLLSAVRAQEVFTSSEKRLAGSLRRRLLTWWPAHGRHTLPWSVPEAYPRWIAEVMLQQTTVKMVLPKYQAWMTRFPSLGALAEASEQEVLHLWQGLGYFARARRLHAVAQHCVAQGLTTLLSSRPALLALPGIGPSTASALGAFVHARREPICEANVIRVLERVLADRLPPPGPPRTQALWAWAYLLTPQRRVDRSSYTQAIMDLGATVCTPRAPACSHCP